MGWHIGILAWHIGMKLKEYADIIADPITKILNASFKEQRVPSIWKFKQMLRHYPRKNL